VTALEPIKQPRRVPVIPNAVLAMLIFIVAEVMFFAGVLSAFTIVKAGTLPGMWPPPNQPRLPAGETAFNTAALLLSAVVLYLSHRTWRAGLAGAKNFIVGAWVLGAFFVVLQGREWVMLLGQGLTMTSSPQGSFFYLIVGTHALHAIVALVALGVAALRMRQGTLQSGFFFGAQIFWYFVVALWPIIYARVYF
jgi:cytochrome c oxidase subunit III